jgi:hypothetical protein
MAALVGGLCHGLDDLVRPTDLPEPWLLSPFLHIAFCGLGLQSNGMEATGYKGFYHHFLDIKTGKRVWKCELSTVDTAFLWRAC